MYNHAIVNIEHSLIRSLLSTEEITRVNGTLETDAGIMDHSYKRSDGHGRNSQLCIWSHPGEDVTGLLARCEKVVTTTEEVCIVDILE